MKMKMKMKTLKNIIAPLLSITLLLSLSACGAVNTAPAATPTPTPTATATPEATPTPTPTPEPEEPVELLISAAASLKDAIADIQTAYSAVKPHVTLTANFGSSGALQQQIEQGAEVDVFISAATKQMDALKDKELIINETRKDFLENQIVLIVPKGTTAVASFDDLIKDEVKSVALGEPASVPVGQYAEEALTSLGLLDKLKANETIVYGKDVKAVLAWVETGEADAGIVYKTDAIISDKVDIVAPAPEGSVKPVYYPAAVIKASKQTEAATDFVNFLYSDEAKPIFEKYGFVFR